VLDAAIAGAIAGYAIAIPVGAIAILILHTGIQHGLRAAVAAAAGAASADGIYAVLAVTLGLAAAGLVAPIETPLRIVAAIVLIGFAVYGLVGLRSAREPTGPGQSLAAHRGYRRTYLALLALTLLNPITVAYFAALVVGLPFLGDTGERLAFVVAVFVASLSWQVLLALIGTALGRGPAHRLRKPSIVVGNLTILGLALAILVDVLSAPGAA
jgi:threonine/homoserine/homoserine lactone efflux protein